MDKIYNMLEKEVKDSNICAQNFKTVLINNQYGELVYVLTSCS